ncbi:MAG: carboxypeptidase-like regulatory domain-containing protein [Flavobacteriaceae bacterium]|nr:carboxypeptidase-like regulatory domain-containing protein [Flavobacteriaceae bacterium]
MIPLTVLSQTAVVEGTVKNANGEPIEEVSIVYQTTGTVSDKNGFYSLKVKADEEVILQFTHIGYHPFSKKLTVPKGKIFRYSPHLQLKTESIKEVNIRNNKRASQGMTPVTIEKVKRIPGANAGIENILKTLPGVNSSNELSTQYQVRGGNFDENLVYVNGIEVYRPFLVRSGQQEGLSFVNVDMIQNIQFSAGGFQAKYDDKLSSVLDITYKKPIDFSSAIDVSFLGFNATLEDVFFQKKMAVLTGIRYRDNSLLVNKGDVQSNFNPQFTDVQSFITYDLSPKLSFQFLGNIAINKYDFQPISRRTKFGTLDNPLELIINYEGRENNRYQTYFSALNTIYQLNENTKLQLTTSSYNTQESEYFDILANYNIGKVDTDLSSENFGKVSFTDAIGSQLNHARNDLDALIQQIYLRGSYFKNNSALEWGLKYQHENIKDKTNEWEIIDSLGFAVRPPLHLPNNQPYTAYEGPIVPFNYINSFNEINIQRWNGFVQWSKSFEWNQFHWWINLGNRFHYWNISGDNLNSHSTIVFSPRFQLAIKPNSNENLLFRISGGFYHQPPSYKELKGFDGQVNETVKAQQSIHLVIGNEYVFQWFERPFKLISELYYKDLSGVNTYTLDNVKIRYVANNNADAFVYGLDLRLNGEFVPGTESWVSFGYLKTEENTDNRGYIARPTDQRLKFGILFQDYVPNIPNLKMYLNLIYNTGVPGGSPSYADTYLFQNRLNDYKRADLGILYVLKDDLNTNDRIWLQNVHELSFGFEIFNMFDVQNSITNTWVRDSYSKQSYGIPNYMSGRIFNLRLMLKI